MMDQIDLYEGKPTEKWVFQLLHNSLSAVIYENNVAQNKLLCKEGRAYSSVWYDTQMAFRICCRNDHHYFGVSDTFAEAAPSEITNCVTRDGRSDGFTNYNFEPTSDGVLRFSAFLSFVLDSAIDRIPKEFDCCSGFEECSNAKRCTNPNVDIATGCGYRKILKKGRIYYGVNRNID